jgi:multiple sugar transport system permease protein
MEKLIFWGQFVIIGVFVIIVFTTIARRPMTQMRRTQAFFIASVLVPVLTLFFIVRIYPMLQTVIISFFKYDPIRPVKPFVGLGNYIRLFMEDEQFKLSIRNSLLFVIITVPGNILIGLLLALVLQHRVKGSSFFESLFFVPYMAPIVPMAIIWQWMYAADGVFNQILMALGGSRVAWMSLDLALPSIMLMFVWQLNGYMMLILLVGLRGIPVMYYEAAAIDGASWGAQFTRITLPLLRPITLYCLIIGTLQAFMVFSQVFVMTQGSDVAPGAAVHVLVLDIYQKGFTYRKMGLASAEAVILLVIILTVTVLQLRFGRSREAK